MEIKLKRIYELKEEADGFRILVDRLYPRGIKKEDLQVPLRSCARSSILRIILSLSRRNTLMSFPKILMQQIFSNR